MLGTGDEDRSSIFVAAGGISNLALTLSRACIASSAKLILELALAGADSAIPQSEGVDGRGRRLLSDVSRQCGRFK